jgi:hypothetical protein
MGWMRRWTVAALAAGTAGVLAAGPVQAAPAHGSSGHATADGPGWRVQKVFAAPDSVDPQAVAMSSAHSGWMMGVTPTPLPTFVTDHWNGSTWLSQAVPAQLTNVNGPWELFSGLYSTAVNDTWFFPDLPRHFVLTQYALRWTGSSWRASVVTTKPDTVLGAAVFSDDNVWTFGQAGPSFPDYGPAVVRHWNGRLWQVESVPLGTPVTIDGAAPDDIWAIGVSKATVPDRHQVMIAMHWDGKSWSSLRLPSFPPVEKGHPWTATAIYAAGARDVWLTETPAANLQTGDSPDGLILLHWNGSAWKVVAKDAGLHAASGLTPDGQGGFWLTWTSAAHYTQGYITDYRDGVFTTEPVPAPSGYTGTATGVSCVPGSRSCWATGTLYSTGSAGRKTDILRDIP